MSGYTPNRSSEIDASEAKRLEENGKTSSSVMANDPDAVLTSDIGEQLSLGIKKMAKTRVNNTKPTKASLADSLVNVAIAAMLENPCMEMKDMWPVLEQLVPGASGDTFQRKLRENLSKLNDPMIDKILKPRRRRAKAKMQSLNRQTRSTSRVSKDDLVSKSDQDPKLGSDLLKEVTTESRSEVPENFESYLETMKLKGF